MKFWSIVLFLFELTGQPRGDDCVAASEQLVASTCSTDDSQLARILSLIKVGGANTGNNSR